MKPGDIKLKNCLYDKIREYLFIVSKQVDKHDAAPSKVDF